MKQEIWRSRAKDCAHWRQRCDFSWKSLNRGGHWGSSGSKDNEARRNNIEVVGVDCAQRFCLWIRQAVDFAIHEATGYWWDRLVAASAPMDDQRGVQETWEMPLHDLTFSTLRVTAATPNDKARLLIETDANAGAWLNALPSPQLGTRHSNESFFRIVCALRLVAETCVSYKCPCWAQVYCLGLH